MEKHIIMHRSVATLCFLVGVLFLNAEQLYAQQRIEETVETQAGVLSVVRPEGDLFGSKLYLNGKLVAEIHGIPSVHETMKQPAKEVVILQLSKASFAVFRVVEIRSNGEVVVSDEFGNGAEAVEANFVGDELRMTTPSYKRPRGQIEGRNYRWKDGKLTEARAAPTLWDAFVNWFAELSFMLKLAFIWPHLAIAMVVFDIPSEDIKSRSRGDEILNTIKMCGLYFAILVIPFEVIYLISLLF